ncbi:zinc finger BED domain-containing protein 4-like [Tachysurus ichikawai]
MREEVRKNLFEHYQSIFLDASGADAAAATNNEEDAAMPVLSQFFGDDYRESSRDEWEQFLLEPSGLIVNRLRSRLSPDHVDMLVFLNKNM